MTTSCDNCFGQKKPAFTILLCFSILYLLYFIFFILSCGLYFHLTQHEYIKDFFSWLTTLPFKLSGSVDLSTNTLLPLRYNLFYFISIVTTLIIGYKEDPKDSNDKSKRSTFFVFLCYFVGSVISAVMYSLYDIDAIRESRLLPSGIEPKSIQTIFGLSTYSFFLYAFGLPLFKKFRGVYQE